MALFTTHRRSWVRRGYITLPSPLGQISGSRPEPSSLDNGPDRARYHTKLRSARADAISTRRWPDRGTNPEKFFPWPLPGGRVSVQGQTYSCRKLFCFSLICATIHETLPESVIKFDSSIRMPSDHTLQGQVDRASAAWDHSFKDGNTEAELWTPTNSGSAEWKNRRAASGFSNKGFYWPPNIC